MRHLTLVAVLLLLLGLAGCGVAADLADTLTGNPYLSQITGEVPAGITAEVLGGDQQLRIVLDGAQVVEVAGYSDEPYARITPDGVELNRNSHATYLNAERFGDVGIPPDIDPGALPVWERVSEEPVLVYHDHRIHWMAEAEPPSVAANPGARQTVLEGWTVPLTVDGVGHALVGDLEWLGR